jgi:dihydrofolate reductase
VTEVYTSISMSLDGYIVAPHDRRDVDVLGERFERLGALIVGRRGYEISVDDWGPEPPFRCPVFVLTHRGRPPLTRGQTTYTVVTEGFKHAIELARRAAGDKDVGLHGGTPIQQALVAGVLDKLQIHLVPVLLGAGRRLVEILGNERIPLELVRVIEAPDVTHVRFRVGQAVRGSSRRTG